MKPGRKNLVQEAVAPTNHFGLAPESSCRRGQGLPPRRINVSLQEAGAGSGNGLWLEGCLVCHPLGGVCSGDFAPFVSLSLHLLATGSRFHRTVRAPDH